MSIKFNHAPRSVRTGEVVTYDPDMFTIEPGTLLSVPLGYPLYKYGDCEILAKARFANKAGVYAADQFLLASVGESISPALSIRKEDLKSVRGKTFIRIEDPALVQTGAVYVFEGEDDNELIITCGKVETILHRGTRIAGKEGMSHDEFLKEELGADYNDNGLYRVGNMIEKHDYEFFGIKGVSIFSSQQLNKIWAVM